MLRVRYLGKSDPLRLLKGKEYEVLSIEKGIGDEDWYRIIDETEEDYLYHASEFEIIDDTPPTMKMVKCPICGQGEFLVKSVYTTCDICGWRNDPYQVENPDIGSCGNEMSLNEYKAAWEAGEPCR